MFFGVTHAMKTFPKHVIPFFFDLKTEEEKVMMALKMILVKVDITGIAFVLDIKKDTILFWLDRTYKKANEINKLLLNDLPVARVELDKMWCLVRRKTNNGEEEGLDSTKNGNSESKEGPQWTWISFAPEYRLICISHRIKCGAERLAKLGLNIRYELPGKVEPYYQAIAGTLWTQNPRLQ